MARDTQKAFVEVKERGTGLMLIGFLLAAIIISVWTQKNTVNLLLNEAHQTIANYAQEVARRIDFEIDLALAGREDQSLVKSLSYVSPQGKVYPFAPMNQIKHSLRKAVGNDKKVFAVPPETNKTTFQLEGEKIIAYKPLVIQQDQDKLVRIFVRGEVSLKAIQEQFLSAFSKGIVQVSFESVEGKKLVKYIGQSVAVSPFPIEAFMSVRLGFFVKRVALMAVVFLVLLYGPVLFYKEVVKGTYANIFEDIQNVMYLISTYTQAENADSDKDIEAESLVMQKRMHYKEFAILAKALESMRFYIKSNMSLLKQRAALDPLTQLPNRTAFQNEVATCAKRGVPFSVLFLDLDGFKQINDELGHEAGDLTLKQVSAVLQQTFRRQDDLVCRYGGDEFVILMLGDISKAVDVITSRIRENIESIDINTLVGANTNKKYMVSTSIGVAVFPQDSTNVEEVVQIADERMYQDKMSRKQNRNALYSYSR